MEAAAGRWTIEARDFTGQDDPVASTGAGVKGGGKERDSVRVRRVGIHLIHAAHFNDPAEVHDRDLIRDVPDDGQIVRDKQIGDAELALQPSQEVDDLCLDRNVERAHWFIANDQIRVDSDRSGDPDPLALSTAELPRVPTYESRVEADE